MRKQYNKTAKGTVDEVAIKQVRADKRVQFNLSLAKLYKVESLNVGVKECTEIIQNAKGDRQQLRLLLHALVDKSLIPAKPLNAGVAKHASLFGVIARTFGKDFVDPLDKPATRKKTLERVLQAMTQNFFVLQSSEVNQQSADSFIQMLCNTFPEYLDI